MKTYKADLHVHSSHSNKPTYWAMRKFNCPESYTSPRHLYQTAQARGMDFITITDHNSINGALEIAHLPNTFLSAEITTHFPENGCKVHVVVLHVSETQFSEIMRLRKNVHELVAFLRSERVAHFLAHPLEHFGDAFGIVLVQAGPGGGVGQAFQTGFFREPHMHPGEDSFQRLAAALLAHRHKGVLQIQEEKTGNSATVLATIFINRHIVSPGASGSCQQT